MELSDLFSSLRGRLIASCQAFPGEPLFGSQHMVAMARAAVLGGAAGIRANGPRDIAAIRKVVSVPVIGLFKDDIPGYEVRITPTFQHARRIACAGADIIAIDATRRPHPGNLTPIDLIDQIHLRLRKPVLADISTFEEGVNAALAGADFIATTLSGYTSYSPTLPGPDFNLLTQLVNHCRPLNIPVIAEGRIATPSQAAQALALGAFAVVVGSAISRPQWITACFVKEIEKVRYT